MILTGRNGSGKTTLLKYIAGIGEGTGNISLMGTPIACGRDYEGHALYLGHRDAVKLQATVQDNLTFWANLYGEPMLIPAAIQYFGLDIYLDAPCYQLSAGWRKRVALARLITNPAALWLLDEPYTHLDEEAVHLLGGLIEGRVSKSGAVIMAAHHLPPGGLGRLQHASVIRLEDFICREGASVSEPV